jgi:hypothetical protein
MNAADFRAGHVHASFRNIGDYFSDALTQLGFGMCPVLPANSGRRSGGSRLRNFSNAWASTALPRTSSTTRAW